MKDKEAFRDYNKEDEIGLRVKRTYMEMHTNQTVEFVRGKHEKWLKFNHFQATIMEVGVNILPKTIWLLMNTHPYMKALEMLNELVDESDPDLDLPNIVHAFQVITSFCLQVYFYRPNPHCWEDQSRQGMAAADRADPRPGQGDGLLQRASVGCRGWVANFEKLALVKNIFRTNFWLQQGAQ